MVLIPCIIHSHVIMNIHLLYTAVYGFSGIGILIIIATTIRGEDVRQGRGCEVGERM